MFAEDGISCEKCNTLNNEKELRYSISFTRKVHNRNKEPNCLFIWDRENLEIWNILNKIHNE